MERRKKIGKGIYNYKNKDKYDGEWADGKKEGKGIYSFSNGNKYDGNWKDDERDGEGIIYFANGEQKICLYSNGVFKKYIEPNKE